MSAGPELENGTAAPVVTRGKDTSEYAETRKAAAISSLIAVLGVITTLGGSIAQALGAETKAGVLCGAVVTIAGVIARTLVTLGYVKSRTDVKAGAQ